MKGERGALIMPLFAKVTAHTPRSPARQRLVPPPAAPWPWPLSSALLGKRQAWGLGGGGETLVLITAFGSRNPQGQL